MIYEKKEVLLDVKNISFSYGDKSIIKDISFSIKNIVRPGVNQGQVLSLIGRSGIGKTTIFKVLSGLLTPKSGSVTVEDKAVKAGDMGIVAQNYVLFNHRSVKKNLQLANPDMQLIISYTDRFGVTEHLNKYPLELSGGQRQRIAIIQQLLVGGDFLLLDEPFSGLDKIVKKEVINVLHEVSLLDEKKTLIVVSHDLESSVMISDTAIILGNNGDGAYIKREIDLIERGLTWQDPGLIQQLPQFHTTIDEISKTI
jgi:ABC-type nitrate/sulfonate/bicarbonate transport system ATPase subunit